MQYGNDPAGARYNRPAPMRRAAGAAQLARPAGLLAALGGGQQAPVHGPEPGAPLMPFPGATGDPLGDRLVPPVPAPGAPLMPFPGATGYPQEPAPGAPQMPFPGATADPRGDQAGPGPMFQPPPFPHLGSHAGRFLPPGNRGAPSPLAAALKPRRASLSPLSY